MDDDMQAPGDSCGWAAPREDLASIFEAQRRQLADAAAELHIQAREELPLGPWVIVGTVDGRGFYLRERSDQYAIVIAADNTPTLDPWTADPQNTITIRTGTSDDLYDAAGTDYRKALHHVAAAVRTYLRQSTCAHPHKTDDRYCSACGLALVDPATPPASSGDRAAWTARGQDQHD